MHCSLWNMIYSGWSNGEDHRYPLKLFTACQDFLSQECEGWYIARKELALRNNLSRAEALQDPGGICGQELIGLSTEIFPKKPSGVSPLRLGKQRMLSLLQTPFTLTLQLCAPSMLIAGTDHYPPKVTLSRGRTKLPRNQRSSPLWKYMTLSPHESKVLCEEPHGQNSCQQRNLQRSRSEVQGWWETEIKSEEQYKTGKSKRFPRNFSFKLILFPSLK